VREANKDFIALDEEVKEMEKKNMKVLKFFSWRVLIFSMFLVYLAHPFEITAQDVSKATVIMNIQIFDGERMLPKGTVVFEKGKITAVGRKVKIPEGAEVLDGNGHTLLPGLIDAHVHVWDQQNLKQSLVFGVTTVIDMFMNVKTMTDMKRMQSSGSANDRAYLVSPGTLVTAPGGHGTQYDASLPTITRTEEAQEFVDARIAEGSDFIKIIYDDGSAYSMPRPTHDKETLRAVIEAAHKRGKIAVVHAATLQNCLDVFEAGGDGLAHLYFNDAFDPEFGRLAAQKKVFVIPTLSVLKAMSGTSQASSLAEDSHLSAFLMPTDIQMMEQSFPFQTSKAAYEVAERALKQLRAEAVPILAGTDAPNPGTTYGASLHGELELLVKAGLTPLEALRAATSLPAAKFDLSDRGRIKSGLIADLVLVKGDPTRDIKKTRNITAVWRNGVKLNREEYQTQVRKAIEARKRQKEAPPPAGSESGLISDFEGDEIKAEFGAGWMVSTDAVMGGKSRANYQMVQEGAQGSKGALLITGNLTAGSQYQWAGAMFSPGPRMMSPANLSFKSSISFWAKGDGKTYTIMIFAQSLGYVPASQNFIAGLEWEEFVFPYDKFNIDGSDIMGIFVGAYQGEGEFTLYIDNVRLK